MIYGNVKTHSAFHPLPAVLQQAISYLSETDFEKFDFGVYQPNEQFSVQVIDVTTKDKRDTEAEVHRKNLDIHYSISGQETIHCRVAPTDHKVTTDKFAERDIGFYDTMDTEVEIPLNSGDFVVFFPGEIHRPACRKGQKSAIKKVVVKISGTDVT
ncbi:MAG: YhcH/YjgK/YiaL family protein [Spirochaetaceae bacterium]|nr:YhcH/YjgK/YiaL family protein [Spirochaetaceae bacterium]MCF7949247.1 YhcH/YjgK/YiaL family protein [Spirochaetia bacterium]MCF7951634.1 YhcH/YjgK/YiaL family protein [Spirochaetaceae bacterium]